MNNGPNRMYARFVQAVVLIGVLMFFAAAEPVLSGPARAAGPVPARAPAGPTLPAPDPFSDLPSKGKFLVASRKIFDPHFRESVILLIGYGKDGVAGIIVNHPTELRLADMLPSVQGVKGRTDVIFYGGPVESRRMIMLFRSGDKPDESGHVFGDVYASASRKALESVLLAHKTAQQFRVYAGYAGWASGQLERELSRGDWLIVQADTASIFEKKASEVWPELMRRGSAIQVRGRSAVRIAGR